MEFFRQSLVTITTTLLLLSGTLNGKERFLITSMLLEPQKVIFEIHKDLRETYLSDNFFAQYEQDIDLTQLDYSIVTMPLIMNIISIVWISGKDFYIEAMDEDLYQSLITLKEIYRRLYPSVSWSGNLIPKKLVNNKVIWDHTEANPGFCMPFSHGLDSVCTSFRHRDMPQLLLTVRGFPDVPLEAEEDHRWEQTKEHVTHFANTHGHKNAYVCSNFHDFFNKSFLRNITPEISHWRLDTVEDLGWMGLVAPILVTKGYKKFKIASGYDWYAPHPGAGNPIVDNNIRYAGITNECDSFDIPRPERNHIIATLCDELNLEKPEIWVCVHKKFDSRKNCCRCQKCVITILGFLVFGHNYKDYGFDIELGPFIAHVKNSLEKQVYGTNRSLWYQYCQQVARKNITTYAPELKEFLGWYIDVDFNRITKPFKKKSIDYSKFTDLFSGIPNEVINQTKRTTH